MRRTSLAYVLPFALGAAAFVLGIVPACSLEEDYQIYCSETGRCAGDGGCARNDGTCAKPEECCSNQCNEGACVPCSWRGESCADGGSACCVGYACTSTGTC